MSVSRQEEIIAALWAVCALLAFGSGFTVWGWIFAVKAATDTACSINCGIREILKERINAAVIPTKEKP